MDIRRAEHAGACYGVQRALDIAEQASSEEAIACTLGPLIHNPKVVSDLAARGIASVDALDQIQGRCVIVRSHGITPAMRRRIEELDVPIIDATCPHVMRAQKAAAQLGESCASVIVVGEEGHPEVEGLKAFAAEQGASVLVAATPSALPAELETPVGIVVQTTQRKANLDAVVDGLRARGVDPVVKDTICSATRQRQEEAAALGKSVDAMVVIGGRNSSNTTRLAEICQDSCVNTYHIESVEELDGAWFEGCETIGVTAGASTPKDQIDSVVDALSQMA